jgi:hypothetical protein
MRWAYGTFFNYFKYKNLFFNKNYGDLGLFVLPSGFLSILLLSSVFLLFLYSLVSKIIKYVTLLAGGWLPSFHLNADKVLIALTEPRILLFVLSVVIGLAFFLMIKSELKERIRFWEYLLYITVYVWFLAIIYIVTFGFVLSRRKLKW